MVMPTADFDATRAAARPLDIGSCWSAGIALSGDQQVYPLSSVNLLVYGVAIS
jgi:hypothetical protein